ncbi:DUF342 domain-containing protein [Caldanaerobius polysaccharolyticus]|uniref:DUF342 domain-containing protein n=1 Tax=Caldanaerobius polysaccharolyticus TaxID=44256 RepID=UPI00146F99E8|nr:FapA family protein [Caldanaerobius polysaccharolyticus]
MRISNDRMKAYINLQEGVRPDVKDIEKFLSERKVVYGIMHDVIKELANAPVYGEDILIAQGKEPKDGKDARVDFRRVVQGGKPQIMDNGSVDYRSLNIVHNVKKGDIIAVVTEATPGTEGKDVMGTSVKPKPGRPLKIKCGQNVILANGAFVSMTDGQLFIKDGKISVLPVLEIENVDMSVGNINFVGNIVVRNDVYSGFEIKAEGDIKIGGNVEDSVLYSKGDIVIGRGVKGKNRASIVSEGSLKAYYLENTKVEVNNDIRCGAIMHSYVKANGNIIVSGKKGLIVGGRVCAYKFIEAKIIGSPMATYTEIEVGCDFKEKESYDIANGELKKVRQEIEELAKTVKYLRGKPFLSSGEKELLKKALFAIKQLDEKQHELEEIVKNTKVSECENPYVVVTDILYSGVKIKIKEEIMVVKDEIRHCKIIYSEGRIKVLAI